MHYRQKSFECRAFFSLYSFDCNAGELVLTLIEIHALFQIEKTKLAILSKCVLQHNEVVDDLLNRDWSAGSTRVCVTFVADE